MRNQRNLVVTALPLAFVLFGAACKPSDSPQDSGTPDTATDAAPSADGAQDLPTRGTTPLGATCGSGSECGSGFCADGACCDSACSDQCYSCQQSASRGNCAPIGRGEDLVASSPCSGTSRCVLD